MNMHRFLLPGTLALICAACGQSPPPDPARRATVPAPDPSAGMPATDGAANVAKPGALDYACDDGSKLRVEYVAETARVELADGRVVALPKAQSASRGGGEVFVGEALSLQRDGVGIQLHQDEGKTLLCRSSEKTG